MKTMGRLALAVAGLALGLGWADDLAQRAWDMESKGDGGGARTLLQQAADSTSATPEVLRDYADFLARHRDPMARAAFEKLLAKSEGPDRMYAARHLALLDLRAGDWDAAAKHVELYRAAGGTDLTLPQRAPIADKKSMALIPGPIRSFARMAALSPDLHAEDLFSALARNIVTNGYQAASSNETLEQTEFLKLVVRYLSQARELDKLAGSDKVIKIETCESSQTGDLLRVLGYRMRGACGSDVVLETVNATRAFLTIDSGFPLAELEQALRTNRSFTYDYKPTVVPVLYGPEYWMSAKEAKPGITDFIDYMISDPSLCRLYLGLSKLDPPTADEIRKQVPAQRLRAYSHVLDFYGGMFEIRGGKAVVPGGARTEKAWADLVTVSPDKGAAFFEKLVAKDDGWLASYYDALARIVYNPSNGPVEDYLTQPDRLKRFYAAIRGKVTSPGPARPVFRSNTDMLLLTTRLRIEANGKPHVPGDVSVWRELFVDHPHGKYDAKLSKAASGWKDGDDVLEALFGLCRKSVENEPLKIFMALSDVDRHRLKPLDSDTADRLARAYHEFGSQFPILAEVPELSNETIRLFIDTVEASNQIRDLGVRSDAAGSLQGLIGLWQIFYRQGSIPSVEADKSFSALLTGFGKVKSEREIFEAGRAGVKVLLAATGSANAPPQDRFIDLLAGAAAPNDSDSHNQLVEEMIRIFEAQRLLSLTTLFDLTDHLESIAKGGKADPALIAKTASRIAEIQLPRQSLSGAEKNALAFGYWSERHIESQRKVNLKALIDKSTTDPKKLDDVRGMLAPFLRDTLVGLNYVHYAPPGAQILLTNPLFVRSHDFVGMQGSNQTWHATEVMGSGWPSSAGGKLVGSLAGLPYALAEAEQNFLIPSREQALIWGDLVPQMLVTATVNRWWNTTPGQLHWVGLHMDFAENAIAEAALNPERREVVIKAISNHAPPVRTYLIAQLINHGQVQEAIEQVTPSEMFAIAEEMSVSPEEKAPLAVEMRREATASPKELSWDSISRQFGTPKPTLANSYSPELLQLRTFPTLMGYSSRILAESWESNLLYYASIADELHLPPSQLNVLIPEWTQATVEHIFATHLEDWPALLRSLRLVGEDVRQKTRKGNATPAGL
ncbi:MAG TPA: hypothetical protein VKU01_04760 [Bryobacteraceae bacterium]|nr:hypothetical protein [Bryobacteraceae bacterium]